VFASGILGGGFDFGAIGPWGLIQQTNVTTFPATINPPATPNIPAMEIRLWPATDTPDQGLTYILPLSPTGATACTPHDLLLWNNGEPTNESLTRLARAILIPPRQNLKVTAQIVSYADNPQFPVATQGSRNMLSLTSNLNQQDYVNKCISLTLDGLLSRDVQ
jgi:hypothetical protein